MLSKQASKKDRPHIIEYFSKAGFDKGTTQSEHPGAGVLLRHHHGAAQVPPVHLWDTLQDLHGPLRPAVPQVQSITILEDATLVVKSQRKNDFDIMYRKRVNEINIADPLSRLGVP